MRIHDIPNDIFTETITQAATCLRCNDFDKAYELITEAMHINPDAPQPHNLLGIWFELKGNGDKARKHYRAAYSLDPTFKPACKNLEQSCTVFDNNSPRTYDFGDNAEETQRSDAVKHCQNNNL